MDTDPDAAQSREDPVEWLELAVSQLFPLRRSLTGEGTDATLEWLGSRLPSMEVREVASGTEVLDWTVPDRWDLRSARVVDTSTGETVVDAADHPLHVLGYSEPVDRVVSREELTEHLHTLGPDDPRLDTIPYRTSYYRRDWGFCVGRRVAGGLGEGPFRVHIDAELKPGMLRFGEFVVPSTVGPPVGSSADEVLISTHICHPGMANDNCTGIAVAALAARRWASRADRPVTARFLFVPGTIGAIAWLATRQPAPGRVVAGLVLTGLGGPGPLTFKRSRRGDTLVDRVAEVVLPHIDPEVELRDFDPYGYDERQFCSPAFDLPVGRLTRTPHGEYPEYHTSDDALGFVSAPRMAQGLEAVEHMLAAAAGNRRWRNVSAGGEPQLGRRGLYRSTGGEMGPHSPEMAYLWVLAYSDGANDLVDVSRRSGMRFDQVAEAAQRLARVGLLALDSE